MDPAPRTDDVDYDVYVGLDVGKADHHACALDTAGRKIHDKALANAETALRAIFTKLTERGRVLAVVDQPAAIGALAIAVARDLGIEVAYLPGLTMRRLADLQPGCSITSQDRRPRRLRHRRRRPIPPPHPAPGRYRR